MTTRTSLPRAVALMASLATSGATMAQNQNSAPPQPAPGVITEGAKGVTFGGAPAARVGDRTSDGAPIAKGSSNVFINGRPAGTVGDATDCGGVVVGGASGIFINGKPVARAGDVTTGCPGQQ